MQAVDQDSSILPPIFPSSRHRYVKVPPRYLYQYILHILRKKIELDEEKIKPTNGSALTANLGGKIGVNLTVNISQEGDISLLSLRFRYGRIITSAALLLIAAAGLSLLFSSPLFLLITAAVLPIAYHANLEAVKFLDILNETLPFFEEEYSRQSIMKDKEKWKRHMKKVRKIYEKLVKKHMDVWGDTNILNYKIKNYQSRGLTYEESIIMIAEEEGVIKPEE